MNNQPSAAPCASPFMTTGDLKEYFQRSARTIDRWRKTGNFPAPIIKSAPNLYRRSEIEAWAGNVAQ